ncbi:MAG TPA: hypothetical protein VJJ22_05310 [Candidatus Paceibacterota bacterium]
MPNTSSIEPVDSSKPVKILTPLKAFTNEEIFTSFTQGLTATEKSSGKFSSHDVFRVLRMAIQKHPGSVHFNRDQLKAFVRYAERKGVLKRQSTKAKGDKSFWFTLGDTTFRSRRVSRKYHKKVTRTDKPKRKMEVTERGLRITVPRPSPEPEPRTSRKSGKLLNAWELTLADVGTIPEWAWKLARQSTTPDNLRKMTLYELHDVAKAFGLA